MWSYIREKAIYCGNRYKEIDIYSYTDAQKRAAGQGMRSKRKKVSEPKQKNLNEKNSRRYFIQTANLNFGNDPQALHVSATYCNAYLPENLEAAEREVGLYLRRIQYTRKKQGLSPLKYMLVTACTTNRETGEPVRLHHHIIMNGGLDRNIVEDLWRKRKRKGEKQGDSIGYCNADRLQGETNGISALCTYLAKQAGGKKRWSSSRNLQRPSYSTSDGKFTRRQVEKWAKERPGKEFWERKYPGWTLTDSDYGIAYEYNQFTGWSIYLKLKRKEQIIGRMIS